MAYNLGAKALSDFNSVMNEHGTTYTITRVTETTDSMGTVSAVSESTFSMVGMIQNISEKDRNVHEMGLAVPGNSKFYCKTLATNGTDEVKEGDIVTDQYSVQWKVTNILKQPYTNDTEIFRSCIIKNITSEGTA